MTRADGLTAVTDIRHWSSPTSSTVVIDLQDHVRYEEHRLSGPDRIYFDLPDTTLEHKLVGKILDIGDAFLLRIRVAQPTPGTTRIVLDTKNSSGYTVRLDQAPYRLVVEVHNADTPAAPKANLDLFAPNKPQTAPVTAQATTPKLTLPAPSLRADKARCPFRLKFQSFVLRLMPGTVAGMKERLDARV